MFLVEDQRHGTTNLVFTWEDPRKAGYQAKVIEGAILDYDMQAVHSWPDGSEMPEVCVGRAPDNPNHYKVFKYRSELQSARFQPVPGTALPFGSWRDYVKVQLLPPDPDRTDDAHWYDYLDRLDEDSRYRRQRVQAPDSPTSTSRDDVAAWVAKKHLLVDTSLRQVWYLPQGAPPEEIRLLELNDRLAAYDTQVEAIDFGLDIEGVQFKLFVADITSEQFDKIRQDPSRLPTGWSLDEDRTWRRGA